MRLKSDVNIKNRRASFDYEILERYVAGIQLYGTEIKSIRESKASLVDTYCHYPMYAGLISESCAKSIICLMRNTRIMAVQKPAAFKMVVDAAGTTRKRVSMHMLVLK